MNNNNNNIVILRSLALLLATVGRGSSSSLAASEENPSLHQLVAHATSFLRKKKSHQDSEGKKCVHDALKELEVGQTNKFGPYIDLKYEKLLAVMETELYKKAASSCKDEIELYDRVGGMVCLAEKESNYTKVPASYAQFWGGESNYGYVYYEGALDLASMFEYTENFTVFGSSVTCQTDCYFPFRGNGCTALENWLSYAGAVSVEQYCTLKWSKIDSAYFALRACAAEAIADPTDGTTKEEYVEHIRANQNSSDACAYEFWVNECKALKANQVPSH